MSKIYMKMKIMKKKKWRKIMRKAQKIKIMIYIIVIIMKLKLKI